MTSLREEIAMHPELVLAAEKFSDTALTVAVNIGGTFVADAVPLGVFLKPLITLALNDLRVALAAKIDHALNEFIQAQQATTPGSGVAGLCAPVVEFDTPPISTTTHGVQ